MEFAGGSYASTTRAIDKLFSLLTEEPRLLSGTQVFKVQNLIVELEFIRALLKDLDARSREKEELGEVAKVWLEKVKEVAERIEDVVDEYILKASRGGRQRGFVSFFRRAGRLIVTLKSGNNLSSDIQNIKVMLHQILERGGQRYGIASSHLSDTAALGCHRDRLLTPLFSENIVGTEAPATELIERLVRGVSGLSVISLVGIGGIGKTTLASIVYRDVSVHFKCDAWITVGHSFNIEDLLRNLSRQIGVPGNHDGGAEELIKTLRQYLQSKKYLFVFDDVWLEHFWHLVEQALPDNELGSRVIITTRSDTVAASCTGRQFDHVHRVELLPHAISWELFCSYAFSHANEGRCPPELEQLCLEITRMCEGSPLAIVAVAGLLSTKEKNVLEWRRLLDNFHVQLRSNSSLSNVSKILALSFRDLPSVLKSCFLYFSIFPKASLIPNDKLFMLWIAEGFVQARAGMTLEDVAEQYLNELIQRNLVQACEGFDGLENFCQVHVLMYEIVRHMADEFSFCQIRDGKNSSFGGKARRLSIHDSIEENVLETIKDAQVRSVYLSNIDSQTNSFVVTLFRKYKLLELLDFENISLDSLPEEVGNLFHLKYLSLKNTKVKRLPKSVSKLQKLQTLDLRNTPLIDLPIEINMLRNLRHILASDYDSNISLDSNQGVWIKEGVGYLENLQTLMTVEASLSGIGVVKELKKLTQLRRLSISSLRTELADALCASIAEMRQLESLSLDWMNNHEILDLENISSAPQQLQRLILKGRLQRLPTWTSSLQNLSMLCLILSRLTDDPLRHVCDLPNLVSLWLCWGYEGEQLHFKVGGFQKLKLLVLRDLQGLEVLEIEEGALPLIEELRIGPSPRLTEVPSGIQHLRSLKVLAFYDMPNEFVLSIQPDRGSDYSKVERVASILFWYRVRGRSYALYELGEPDLLDHLQGLDENINGVGQRDLRWSYSYSDDEADSASVSTSVVPWDDRRLSFSSDRLSSSSDRFSFFSDDIED